MSLPFRLRTSSRLTLGAPAPGHPAEGSHDHPRGAAGPRPAHRDDRAADEPAAAAPRAAAERGPARLRAGRPPPGGRRARRRDDPRCWSWSARARCTTRRRPASTPTGCGPGRPTGRRPARRDARLLREAALHGRLEGPDQRPGAGRHGRRQHRPADRPQAAARGGRAAACRSAWSSSTRSPRSTSRTLWHGARSAHARSSRQVHRQLASGLSMPIGMKNRPDGSIATAIDAINAAAVPHVFPGIDFSGTPAILHTRGNPDCHLVLRGGGGRPNYDAEDVAGVAGPAPQGRPARAPGDRRQPRQQQQGPPAPAAGGRGRGRAAGGRPARHRRRDAGVASWCRAGRSSARPALTYGQSVTDACMGWDPTVEVLERPGHRHRQAPGRPVTGALVATHSGHRADLRRP